MTNYEEEAWYDAWYDRSYWYEEITHMVFLGMSVKKGEFENYEPDDTSSDDWMDQPLTFEEFKTGRYYLDEECSMDYRNLSKWVELILSSGRTSIDTSWRKLDANWYLTDTPSEKQRNEDYKKKLEERKKNGNGKSV